jgi:serine/threonine protein kinase
MGAVYEAKDLAQQRRVALKLLTLEGTKHEARFQREAEAIATLSHPNVLQVHAAGFDQGLPYLVMELVDGESLEDRLKLGPLPPEEATRILIALARGVQHAHDRGVLHRDLKPANVLMAGSRPLLADFGLAKLQGSETLTSTGDVLGTPGYMAPEQVGTAVPLGPATDVYGLGATLYALVTGHPPFTGTTIVNTLSSLVREAPVAPSVRRPEVTPELETVILRCLAKKPSDRYASANALIRALHGEPDSRSTTSGFATGLIVGGVIVAAFAGVFFAAVNVKPTPAIPPTDVAPTASKAVSKPATPTGPTPADAPSPTDPPSATPRSQWKRISQREKTTWPRPRQDHALAFDTVRNVTWLVGGKNRERAFAGLWYWDGRFWHPAIEGPGPDPGARQGHTLVFDSARNRLLIAGGRRFDSGNGDELEDTWEWDGNAWKQVANLDQPRAWHCAAYDSARRSHYVFGGIHGNTALAGLWEWDGESWAQLDAGLPGPAARYRSALAYDARREVLVLFGGVTWSREKINVNETWEWDGQRWRDCTPRGPGSSPGPTRSPELAFDGTNVLLWGGANDPRLWTWDGDSWTAHDDPKGPPAHTLHAMTYDSKRRRLVTFGGFHDKKRTSDLWEFRSR